MPLFGGPPDIAKLKFKGNVKGLIKALDYESDFGIRRDAAYALGEIGDTRVVEPLISTLSDIEWPVRRAAALALGRIGDGRVLVPLIAVLQDPVAIVRQSAAEALGEIGDPRAVDSLTKDLQDAEGEVRKACAQALDKLGWQPNRDEISAYYWMVEEKWDRCVEIGLPAIPALIHATKEWKYSITSASRALAQIRDPQALEPFIVALKDENTQVRRAAASALGDSGDERAVDPLIAALDDEDWDVRIRAALGLGKIGTSQAVQPLIEVLMVGREGYGQDVRPMAARALGMIGDERAIEPLIAALREAGDSLPPAAADALGEIGGSRVVEPLIQALNSDEVLLCSAAATALGKIGDPQVVESLMRAFESDVYRVNSAAEGALEKMGEPAIEPLLITLTHTNRFTRVRAIQILGRIGDLRCVGPLILAVGDSDGGVQNSAVEALVTLVEPEVGQVAVKDLQALADLEDTVGFRHISSTCANEPDTDLEWNIDCSRLRQLARQELVRRGL